MKNLLLLTALGVGAWWLYEKSKSCKSSDEISLENLRIGIANGWYEVKLMAGKDENGNPVYNAILNGQDTEGNPVQDIKDISQATYEALKADGVPEV